MKTESYSTSAAGKHLGILVLSVCIAACGSSGGGGGGEDDNNDANDTGDTAPVVNQAPVITTAATASIVENTTTVLTVIASDPDNDPVEFSIVGGSDQALFNIDSTTGVISFLSSPDFESPSDSDNDNVYLLDIAASDASHDTSQSLQISVLDEPPPAAPGVSVDFAPKQLQFSWPAVASATNYRLLHNPDGASGYVPSETTLGLTASIDEISVFQYDWSNARYLVEACSDEGCTSSSTLSAGSGAVDAIGYFKGSQSAYVRSLSLAGEGYTMAIGAPYANAVLIYRYNLGTDTWYLDTTIESPNGDGGDLFGNSVALDNSGSRLVVGAPMEDSAATGIDGNQADNSAADAGAAYVFARDISTGNWNLQAYIKASNAEAGDQFGWSVDMNGYSTRIAVGARFEDSRNANESNNEAPSAGAVYVYIRSFTTWVKEAYLKNYADAGDLFGFSVSLNNAGDRLAVGAPGEAGSGTGILADFTDNSAPYSGAAYVFYRDSVDGWLTHTYVKASNTGSADQFGYDVALDYSGYYLAAGAPGEASNATGINGNQSNNFNAYSGAVYLFHDDMSGWTQNAYIKASNSEENDQFGYSVALNAGDRLIVGAPREDSSGAGVDGMQDNALSNSGSAYLFYKNSSTGTWSQHNFIKASNPDIDDQFGTGVDINIYGSTLMVGAPYEDSNATGINGDQTSNSRSNSGAIYLY